MRFLLDTNVLIPLEDSQVALAPSLALFVRLANDHGHPLVYHPSSELDINKDKDPARRRQTLERLHQYVRLDHLPACPWNDDRTDSNDAIDNEILHAISNHAARFLVTEDLGIHRKARSRGLEDRVLTIQMAADLLRRLYERVQVHLPNISEVPLHAIVHQLPTPFFDSLREGYQGFDRWFRGKAEDGRDAWVCRAPSGVLRGLCVFVIQTDERITDDGDSLSGPALKLCTFKVAEQERGQKIGELLLKAAFQYASRNRIEHIFITADGERQQRLIELLEDFGFGCTGNHGRDAVYVKRHPTVAPPPWPDPVPYHRAFFPHHMDGEGIRKFIVPVVPRFHQILFPDYHRTGDPTPLFEIPQEIAVGNAIKLAYLCHGTTNQVRPGDLVFFYRSGDHKALTSLGVVERFETMEDAEAVIGLVRRRTVYSMEEIQEMADRPTKVMLFRHVQHLHRNIPFPRLVRDSVLKGPPQSITQISHESYQRLMEANLA
jgi:GNAT superfamily N-acetyltransferase